MYVCMYVYMYICMYVCMYMYICIIMILNGLLIILMIFVVPAVCSSHGAIAPEFLSILMILLPILLIVIQI